MALQITKLNHYGQDISNPGIMEYRELWSMIKKENERIVKLSEQKSQLHQRDDTALLKA